MLDTNPVHRKAAVSDRRSDAESNTSSDANISAPVSIIGNTGMTRWVEQIGELLTEATVREDWYVIGSAAILEHNVERQAFDIAQAVAERLGVSLVEWTDHYEEVVGPAILYVDRAYWGKHNRKQVLDGDYELVSPELGPPCIGSWKSLILPSPSS